MAKASWLTNQAIETKTVVKASAAELPLPVKKTTRGGRKARPAASGTT